MSENKAITLQQAKTLYDDLRQRQENSAGALDEKAPVIINAATGNPAVFSDGADGLPIQSLKVHLLPRQEGSGDPSPENILPITGWTGVNVEYYEENLYSGGDKSFTRYTKINLSNPLPAGTYFFAATVNSNAETNNSCIAFARNENDVIAKAYLPKNGRNSVPFSVSDTVNIIYLYAGTHYSTSEGASAVFSGIFITETAADRYPVTFPSTIFGGYVDMVTGEVWATHDGFTKKWSEYTSEIVLGNVARREFISPTQRPTETELNDDATSRYCNVATWRYNYMSDNIHFYGGGYSFFVFLPVGTDEDTEITIVTKKKSPILITTLTPQQINAIKGDNTIWSDANGDIEVEYRADTELFIEQNTVKDVQIKGTSILQSGIANFGPATNAQLGLLKINTAYGMYRNDDDVLYLVRATDERVKGGTYLYQPIVPRIQHQAAFYGLAKAAGADMASSSNTVGQYTDAAKVAIQKMLGIYEAPWELIREDTFTNAEEADHIITVDENGDAFELTDVVLMFETPVGVYSAKGAYGQLRFYQDISSSAYRAVECGAWTQEASATKATGIVAIIEKQAGGLVKIGQVSKATSSNSGNFQYRYGQGYGINAPEQSIFFDPTYSIKKIAIPAVTGNGHYKLYGKRKWN